MFEELRSAGPAAISRGRATDVAVEIARGGKSRKWVIVFTLAGRRMFFVDRDVSLFARNPPTVLADGDDLIISGRRVARPFYAPRERPAEGYYQATVLHVGRTGAMCGGNGNARTFLGGIASIVGAGLLTGTVSAGLAAMAAHGQLLVWSAGLIVAGGLAMADGMAARAAWAAVKSAAGAEQPSRPGVAGPRYPLRPG